MTASVAVIVPALARPHRAGPLTESLRASTTVSYRVVFVCDPLDVEEQQAATEAGAEVLIVDGGYAAKINMAVRETVEPFVFTGADDIVFQPGWFEAAQAEMARTGALVVGVNDMLRRRRRTHATHFLVAREYALEPCIDGSRGPLFEGYSHSFTDDELIATARHRGVYSYAERACVEHQHWLNRKAPDDEVYRRGRIHFHRDRDLFRERGHLWA